MSVAPYQVSGHYDEMSLPSGEPRPHWRKLMAELESLGREEFLRRWRDARRLIRENGVSYNVYGDPRGMDRPWQLDPIPMLISAEEWAGIEQAVTQRATLLDRILADLYGPGRLLREGRLPAELVFAHPGFLRPCHGVAVPGGVYLHVYAADLARSPDGQWWVIADRTQAPSGAGYALENRVVMSRTLPELFGDFFVRRLAGYFQAYREALTQLSPRDNPRVVLLTPGPYNETYFEHAYLARYLGFTLVEGRDLTVRGDRVFLKTLSGLLPVDVILRRQDDDFCDPLELRGESALGTPGLVQAVRAGNVAVANALGSGIAESAATTAFLPGLCRQLLGEELKIPSVATWWCGQERELEHVIRNLESLVVKPTFPSPRREVVFGRELSSADRQALVAELRARPSDFVAQEQVALSTVPSGGPGDGPTARHLVLRVYAVASGGSYAVMPGGLTRVSVSAESLVVSSQQGGASKDTWVLADAPVPYVSLLPRATSPIDVSRGTFALTSRVADDLLWLGRASERVEAGVRLFRSALRSLSEQPIRSADAPEPDAVELLERTGRLAPRESEGAEPPLAERLLAGLFDSERPESLRSAVTRLHRLTWRLRDRISTDAWRVLSRLDQEFTLPRSHPALLPSAGLQLLDETLVTLSAFSGLVLESMTRGLGWQFLEVGRRLERGLQAVELLRRGLVEDLEEERLRDRLETLLEIADSTMTYRSRYLTSVQLPLVLDLLLVDEANPRSLAFQLVRLEQRFATLTKAPRDALRGLLQDVREAPLAELVALEPAAEGEGPAWRPRLASLLDELVGGLPLLAEALNHAYLSHAIPRRRSTGPWRGRS